MLLFRFLFRIYNLYFSPDKQLAQRVRQMTGFVPARLAIFKLAFSHKSNQSTRDAAQTNNERLEYLGDAVLGTVVAEYLFKKYPNANEGFLTKMRSKIVKRKSLNHIGDQMGLDVLLAEYNRTRLSSSMLGNAVEALVGAVYLEKGYDATKRFIIKRMLKLYVDMHELETVDDNYKSQLLEHCQKNGKSVAYQLVKKYKHDRRDKFKVGVMVGGKQVATADDFNKKAAEQLASLRALEKMGVLEKEAAVEAVKRIKPKATPARATKQRLADKSAPKKERKPRAAKTGAELAAEKEALALRKETKRLTPKPKPAQAAPEPQRAEQAAPRSQAAKPPRKQQRNNSSLGRSVWHATRTTASALAILDPQREAEVAREDSRTDANGAAAKREPASPQRTARRGSRSIAHAVDISAAAVNLIGGEREIAPEAAEKTSATAPVGADRAPAVREAGTPRVNARPRRRPVPLYVLEPMIANVSTVAQFEWSPPEPILGSLSTPAGEPARKSPAQPVVETGTTTWEDTPLVFDPVDDGAPVEPEAIDGWEDTLLEIAEVEQAPTRPRKR